MSIDPMQCAQSDLVRLVETGVLPLNVTYDRRPVNGKDTLTVMFPKWVYRDFRPSCVLIKTPSDRFRQYIEATYIR